MTWDEDGASPTNKRYDSWNSPGKGYGGYDTAADRAARVLAMDGMHVGDLSDLIDEMVETVAGDLTAPLPGDTSTEGRYNTPSFPILEMVAREIGKHLHASGGLEQFALEYVALLLALREAGRGDLLPTFHAAVHDGAGWVYVPTVKNNDDDDWSE